MIMNLFDLKDRVVVMTGATGVLGKSISEYFALQGAKVVVLVRESSIGKGEVLVSEIKSKGGDAVFLVADVMDKSSLESAYEKVMADYGRVDVLMNAAGGNMPAATVAPDKTIFDLNTDAVKTVSDLNLFGTVLPTMVFAKAMAQQKAGSIINFASESALRPLTRVAGYGVAKAAVVNWTKYLCAEMAMKFGEGIRVNAIAPGFILTDQNRMRTDSLMHSSITLTEDGKIGVQIKDPTPYFNAKQIKYGFFQSFPAGIAKGWEGLVSYVKQFRLVFTKAGAQSVGGFVAIGNMFPATWNWSIFWSFTAFISIALAFMNFLPIPVLDGGYFLMLIYEMITGRKPNDRFMEIAANIGMFLLLALLIFANGNDIIKLIMGKF